MACSRINFAFYHTDDFKGHGKKTKYKTYAPIHNLHICMNVSTVMRQIVCVLFGMTDIEFCIWIANNVRDMTRKPGRLCYLKNVEFIERLAIVKKNILYIY
jgi:hypothetical protein